MIDRRINYQYGGGADMGASSSKGPSAPPGGGATSLGSGRDFSISGAGDRIRDVAERQRRQELANLATQTFDQGDTSKDQFGFGATFRNEGIGGLARQYLTPSTILGGILGLINPFAGFAFRALKNIPNVRNIGEYKTLQDFYQNEIKPSPLGAQPVTAAGQADMMGTLNQFPSISGGITTVQPNVPQFKFDPTNFNTRNRLDDLRVEVKPNTLKQLQNMGIFKQGQQSPYTDKDELRMLVPALNKATDQELDEIIQGTYKI